MSDSSESEDEDMLVSGDSFGASTSELMAELIDLMPIMQHSCFNWNSYAA